jgi:DNA-binding response OmpR family regulator
MSERPTVLVVDDERNIRGLLRMYLEQDGYIVEETIEGEAALRRLDEDPPPDLMILDLMLPGVDGWEVCRQVRGGPHSDLPILMLTARDDDVDKIVGLELGADDYVTKPFNPREIVARVKAILRRAGSTAGPPTVDASEKAVRLGDVTVDPLRRQVTVGEREVELRRKEFDLLAAMVRQAEIVLSREQLLDQVWGYDYYGRTRTVDAHIASLRRKIAGSEVRIETVTGVGYRIIAAVD